LDNNPLLLPIVGFMLACLSGDIAPITSPTEGLELPPIGAVTKCRGYVDCSLGCNLGTTGATSAYVTITIETTLETSGDCSKVPQPPPPCVIEKNCSVVVKITFTNNSSAEVYLWDGTAWEPIPAGASRSRTVDLQAQYQQPSTGLKCGNKITYTVYEAQSQTSTNLGFKEYKCSKCPPGS
jgi:hypothetical protein